MKNVDQMSMDALRHLVRYRRTISAMLLGSCLGDSHAQVTAEVVWQRCIGGSAVDWGMGFTETSDGGFVCVGTSASNDGDASDNHGGNDILVAKLDMNGTVLWHRSLGGSSEEFNSRCLEASDGSIMIIGNTFSSDGDVSFNNGGYDIWVVKLAPDGSIIWERAYGGSGMEQFIGILETQDGGFVVYGPTSSVDGDVVGFHAGGTGQDEWVFKIDPSGALVWSRALGGTGTDVGGSVIELADGGFLVKFTYTNSTDGDVVGNHGAQDAWLVKLGFNGDIEWSRTIGGSQEEIGYTVLETNDGGIVLLGSTRSTDGDITTNQGASDAFLTKLASDGSVLWMRTYGGSSDDVCWSIVPLDGNGFLLAGISSSSDGDVGSNSGDGDAWLLEVDELGDPLWRRTYGGSMDERVIAYAAPSTGYLIAGLTFSNDGDVLGNHGDQDVWIARVGTTGDLSWQRCLGGSMLDSGTLGAITSDNSYIIYGYTDSNDGDVTGNHGSRDIWVVKLRVTEPPEPVEPLECALFVPNAFSPDNSTTNDAQCIYGTDCVTSMTFKVFDRWGNKVFESTDPNACWDGTYNGQALDPAVFVYHLNATLANAEVVEKQGNITLVR